MNQLIIAYQSNNSSYKLVRGEPVPCLDSLISGQSHLTYLLTQLHPFRVCLFLKKKSFHGPRPVLVYEPAQAHMAFVPSMNY